MNRPMPIGRTARDRLLGTGRKRNSAFGRLYSVSGGAPNHPLVAFCASAGWLRVGNRSHLTPQALVFERGYSRAEGGGAEHVADWIAEDLAGWREAPLTEPLTDAMRNRIKALTAKGRSRTTPKAAEETAREEAKRHRQRVPLLVAVEISQNPNLFRDLDDLLRDEADVLVVGYRLRTGDQNVTEKLGEMQSGAHDVGANWLAGWFDAHASVKPPTDTLYGRPFAPGKIAVTFTDFRSEEAPGIDRTALRSSLSAAESLRAKAQKDGDLALALTADESKAAAIMVAALAADQTPPPAVPPAADQTAWGWKPWADWGGGPIRSRYTGVS